MLTPVDGRGTVRVSLNGQGYGKFRPTRQIVVWAGAGDDSVRLATLLVNGKPYSVRVPAILFGQLGNDVLDAVQSRT